MAVPQLIVEVAFTTDPYTVPGGGAWTDITAYVRSVSTKRGRAHESSRMEAGEATITLDNGDRRFDPTYASSPYSPNVIPLRRIRIRAVWNATTYNLFYGFVEDWGQSYPGRPIASIGDAEVTVHAVDAFKLLNQIDLTSYRSEVIADAPLLYWPLQDPTGATRLENLGSLDVTMRALASRFLADSRTPLAGGGHSLYTYQRSFGDTTDLPDDDLRVLKSSGAAEWWVWIGDRPLEVITILSDAGGASDLFRVGIDSAGKPYFGHSNGAAGSVKFSTISDAAWHHVVINREGSEFRCYVDSADVGTAQYTDDNGRGAIDAVYLNIVDYTTALSYLAHVAIYDHPLSPERVGDHFAAGLDAIAEGQTIDAAIGIVLDAAGWPSGNRTIATSDKRVATFLPDGNVLELLLDLAEGADGGILYVRPNGNLAFESSAALEAVATSALTWGDGGGAELAYADLELRYDDQDIWNTVRVSAEAIGDQVVTDQPSEDSFGPRTLEIDATFLGDPNAQLARAQGALARYKDPHVRIEGLTAAGTDTSRMAGMFGSDVTDRNTVKRRPPGGGSAISQDVLVEGISHEVSRALGTWNTKLDLTPPLTTTVPWILADATYGVLGSTTALGW